jgi:hypothetical protein
MLNHGIVLVLGYTVLETWAENTKKVMAWHNKQKETAPKQDISEDLQEFSGPKLQRAKTQPSRPFLGVPSVPQLWLDRTFRAEHFEWSHVKNRVRMQKLWPVEVCCRKLSKTDETVQIGLDSDWTSRNGSNRLGCGFDFFFCSSSSSCLATET